MCGFHMSTLDAHYGADDMMMDQITDTTELLTVADREELQVEIDEFEDQFPPVPPRFLHWLPSRRNETSRVFYVAAESRTRVGLGRATRE